MKASEYQVKDSAFYQWRSTIDDAIRSVHHQWYGAIDKQRSDAKTS
jgi:hypothetical protein